MWIHEADAEAARTGTTGRKDGNVLPYLLKAEFYRTMFSLGRRSATKIFTIFEGTSEIQRMIIGRAVTGLDVR